MFISSESIQNLTSVIPEVWEIYASVNQPVIALPEKSPEPTWAYVIAIKTGKKMKIYIYLFREQSREGVFYIYEQGDIELVNAKAVFNEALDFTGSMGFIMERVELGDTQEQKEEAIKSIPAFMTDLKMYRSSSTGDELVLDTVYEAEQSADEKSSDKTLKNNGGRQWFAKILSLF
jgi:hypothetical protein